MGGCGDTGARESERTAPPPAPPALSSTTKKASVTPKDICARPVLQRKTDFRQNSENECPTSRASSGGEEVYFIFSMLNDSAAETSVFVEYSVFDNNGYHQRGRAAQVSGVKLRKKRPPMENRLVSRAHEVVRCTWVRVAVMYSKPEGNHPHHLIRSPRCPVFFLKGTKCTR